MPDPSFEEYVRASGPRLKRLAYLLTGDLHDAEDLLQTAYAKAMPHWKKVSRYDSPDAYLRRTMVSIRTSWWRRHKGRDRLVADVPEQALSRSAPGGIDLDESIVDHQMLLQALRGLPERQRAAVVLRHWCDLSEAETADTMGCGVGAVKSATSRGLANLRAAMAVPATSSPRGDL